MHSSLLDAAEHVRSLGRAPLVSRATVGSWVVESWRESWRGWLPDLAAVEASAHAVRLVVADPAENALVDDAAAHSAGAVAAVWDHARRVADPSEALAAASAAVCDPALRPHHRNPLCAALLVDLDPVAPRLTGGARAADGDLWVRAPGADRFEAATSNDMLTAEARARHTAAVAEAATAAERWAAQEATLDDPAAWLNPVIGLVPDPDVEPFAQRPALEVIVTTDGARLEPATDPHRFEDLDSWLAEGICDVGADWPHPHPFGDLAVLRARFVGR